MDGMSGTGQGAQTMKYIEPLFSIAEDGETLSLHWWNGDKSLGCYFDAKDTQYIGTSETGQVQFETLYAGYQWLVGVSAAEGSHP